MKLINRIEIHRFRSVSDATIDSEDLVIFSGLNNSGKSNVLRALNLFFNGETSFDTPHDFSKDYNQAFTGQAGGKRVIKITLHFEPQGEAALSSPFSIARSFEDGLDVGYEYLSSDEKIQDALDRSDGNIRRQFTIFLGKIEYFYIPAVRDKKFVQNLFLNFEKLIDADKDKDFERKIGELSGLLSKRAIKISNDFEKFIGLPTEAALSSRTTDILGTVEVRVNSGIKVNRRLKGVTQLEEVKLNLFSSGDGILMSYLAYFLAHVCKELSNKKFIWGFEEPENSLEYSKTQKLSQEFYDKFTKDAQIFITTHSPAFMNLRDRENTAFYRVYIDPTDTRRSSEIATINRLNHKQQQLFKTVGPEHEQYIAIQKELGMIELAQEIEQATEALLNEKQQYIQEKTKYIKTSLQLLSSLPPKIFICEDDNSRTIALWEKWLAEVGLSDIRIISSKGSSNDFVENGIAYQMSITDHYRPKVFRQIDRDGLTSQQMSSIEGEIFNKYNGKYAYKLKFLPVNEIENFAIIGNSIFDDTFWAEIQSDIVSHFELTAEDKCKKYDKLFAYRETTGFRGNGGGYMPVVHKMRAEGLQDWRKYMPGKTIAARKDNFHVNSYLSNTQLGKLPKQLQDYIDEVKTFFE